MTGVIPRIAGTGAQFNDDGTALVSPNGDTLWKKHLGSVLMRFIYNATDEPILNAVSDVQGATVSQTITKAASGASTPYNYLKWGELVYDDTGATSAIYTSSVCDRIIVPAGARLARVNASFAANPSSSASTNITGAANNGSGAIRLTVTSAADFATGNSVTVAGVVGTTEANASWSITKIDATHIDLNGSTFTNAWVSGGTVTGSLPSYLGLRIYGGASGTTNKGNTKLFSFHKSQSNNILTPSAWLPVTPGDILRIGLLQDTAADWINPAGDLASSYFGVEFMA